MEKWRLLTRLQLYLHTVSGSAGLEWAEKLKQRDGEMNEEKTMGRKKNAYTINKITSQTVRGCWKSSSTRHEWITPAGMTAV